MRDHECAGCGGSGPHEYGKGTRLSSAYTIGRDGKDCPSYVERGSVAYTAWKRGRAVRCCPVCLGSGRISDRMPVADAVADAETLCGIKAEDGGQERHRGRCRRWHMTLLGRAQRHGESAASYTKCDHGETSAPYFSREAARAAFRAVPGLKGETSNA